MRTNLTVKLGTGILCLSLLLAGCKGGEAASSSSLPASSAPASSVEASSKESAPAEVTEISAVGQFPAEFDFEDPVLLSLYEKAGVNIHWEIIPSSSYTERLTIILASNQLPDLMQIGSATTYRECYENGTLLPLTGLIAASPNIQKYEDPASLIAATAPDGEIYGLPRNSVPRTDGFIVRKDWLDKVGITLPADGMLTLDEFTEICRAFTEDDPDGNGIHDTYGVTYDSTGGVLAPFVQLLIPFNASNQFEPAPEGSAYKYMNPRYSKDDPSYLHVLEYMNMLWTSGYIDPNWPANDGTSYMDRFQSGVAGMTRCFGGWFGSWRGKMLPNFPDVEFGYIYGIKNDKGEVKARSTMGANVYGYWTVTRAGEGKEQAIVRFFDYLLSDEGWDTIHYGIEGYHYTTENGKRVYNDTYASYNAVKSYMALVRRCDSPNLWLSPALPEEELQEMSTIINGCIANVLPSLDLSYSPPSASDPVFIDYRTTLDTVMSKIITGDQSPDAWLPALDGWYAAGGEQYIQEMNEYIESTQK